MHLMRAAKTAKLAQFKLVTGLLPLESRVIPVATRRAFEKYVAFFVFHIGLL